MPEKASPPDCTNQAVWRVQVHSAQAHPASSQWNWLGCWPGSVQDQYRACLFCWAQFVFQMAEPDAWHHLAIYQKDPKSGCGVSLRIRGPERLKLKSFRWIFWVSNFETFPGVFVAITCANGAHLWPVWSSMLIPFLHASSHSIPFYASSTRMPCMNLFWFA